MRGADVVLSLVGGAAALPAAMQALPHAARRHGVRRPQHRGARREGADRRRGGARGRADGGCRDPRARAARGRTAPSCSRADRRARRSPSASGPFGVPIEVLDGGAGEAARLRLLRSVFMKGLAALVIEGVGAARAVGAEEWLRDQMAGELGPGRPRARRPA